MSVTGKRKPHKPPRRKPTWSLDCTRLREIDTRNAGSNNPPTRAYVDRERGWCIQVYEHVAPGCDGTPWEGTFRVSVKHTSARTLKEYERRSTAIPITWDELQEIKDHFWPGRIALEVYPPQSRIVDVAEMRHLYVLPAGAVLPFCLSGASTLESEATA